MMHGHGKSDSSIVLTKPPNEAGPEAKEAVKERRLAKGKTPERNMSRTQGRSGMSSVAGPNETSKENTRWNLSTCYFFPV